MSLRFILFFAILLSFSCAPHEETEKGNSQDFAAFCDDFIEELWRLNPGWATYEGYHKYDHVLQIPDEATREASSAAMNSLLDSLQQYDFEALTPLEKADFRLIENHLNSSLWYQKEYRSFEWNPSQYNVAGGFARILHEDFASLEERLKPLSEKIKHVPAYYAAAKVNLKDVTKEHTQLAIDQNLGGKYAFAQLKDSVRASSLSETDKTVFISDIDSAVQSIQSYCDWLQQDILTDENRCSKSFRIGAELYKPKFEFSINVGLSAEEVYQNALTEKEMIHGKMSGLADKMWEKYFGQQERPNEPLIKIKMLIDTISSYHTERDSFIPAIKIQLPELTEFVKEKDLLYMDPSKPLKVRETPEYMRGVAGASISSPGPYEKDAKTYYNVTPLDGYSDEEAESYLREYNDYMLQILNIHEAIPGHYAQLVYSNNSPSMIKSILGNGSMVEGWACYTERMMLEEGYGNFAPELWLMYYKWNLRIVCNSIIDYGIHVENLSEEECLALLMNEAFQENAEATKKWKRAKLTSVQLCSYYAGLSAIYTMREEIKQIEREQFSLKEFHEKFLSYGSSPIPVIRELMGY